jgi:acyl-CoA dehydrogenase
MTQLYVDALDAWLQDQCPPAKVRAIDGGAHHQTLWQSLDATGFANALVPEAQGGAGLALSDAFGLWRLAGQYALPLPLAETMLARGWLARTGTVAPVQPIVLARLNTGADGSVEAACVRHARVAEWVLAVLGQDCRLLPMDGASAQGTGFCLDARLSWAGDAWAKAVRVPGVPDLLTWQAALYAALLSGAMQAVFQRTLQFANEREQFGRAIGKFQAIQHQLSVMAELVAVSSMAARMGCMASSPEPVLLNAALAKARCSEAAAELAGLSHSIHGAMGFTAEFDLQLYTRRLHAWRQAGGSESHWHDVVGRALLAQHDGPVLDLIRELTDPVNH